MCVSWGKLEMRNTTWNGCQFIAGLHGYAQTKRRTRMGFLVTGLFVRDLNINLGTDHCKTPF